MIKFFIVEAPIAKCYIICMRKQVEVIHKNVGGGGGAVYGLGLLGALFYYVQTSHNITEALFGILKSILWPAFLIYSLLASNHF